LPAVVMSITLKQLCYNRSVFERLAIHLRWPVRMLQIQYRMHPHICAFSNEQWYENKLQTDESINRRPPPLWNSCYQVKKNGDAHALKPHHIFDHSFV